MAEVALKLITEEAENIQLVEAVNEQSGAKSLYLEGIFSSANRENRNGRRYKKEILEREVNKLMPEIKAHRLYGELNHPDKPEVNLKEACILVEDLTWNGDNIMGKSYVLETPNGDIVKACLKRGMVGVSSRGLGTVGNDGYVNEDYQMLTYDVVSTPSNQPSWVKGICESKQYIVNESGIIVREESVLVGAEKEEAVNDAMSEMEQKIKQMVEAVVEEKIKSIEEAKKALQESEEKAKKEQEIDEVTATQMYTKLLKDKLKETFEKLM